MNNKIPTPIVDKNGVVTTRHKNPDKATKPSRAGAAPVPKPTSPRFSDDPHGLYEDSVSRFGNALIALNGRLNETIENGDRQETERLANKILGLNEALTYWEEYGSEKGSLADAITEFDRKSADETRGDRPSGVTEGWKLASSYINEIRRQL